MRIASMVAATLAITLAGCTDEDPLSPHSIAGVYPLAQVDGHDPGWYHPLDGEYCDAAFLSGSLVLGTDEQFRLDLDYDYRCYDSNGRDGHSSLVVAGATVSVANGSLHLDGCGPRIGYEEICPAWTLDVRPAAHLITVRFLGLAGAYWGDPILTMGPRR